VLALFLGGVAAGCGTAKEKPGRGRTVGTNQPGPGTSTGGGMTPSVTTSG
jgi:hypothetical protein